MDPLSPARAADDRRIRRRWAMLIKRVYQADPLLCPRCGGTMKIIAFIEARHGRVIESILRHCGLWQDPANRGPPLSPPQAALVPAAAGDSKLTYQSDGDYLDFTRQEQAGQFDA
jgi:hypothetical protein